jgi:hypothetical protein
MRNLYINIVFFAYVAFLSAEEPIARCPLRANAFYCHPAIVESVNVGDTVTIMLSLRNESTNLVVLSLQSVLISHYEGRPEIVLSNICDKATGSLTEYIAPGGGGVFGTLCDPFITSYPSRGDAYVFINPKCGYKLDLQFMVPKELGEYPFTSVEFDATIISDDSGQEYGLNAWTGTLDVAGCTIPLRKAEKERGQPTNAPYSSPEAGSKR